eukprot:COSAG05_NODE_44_length_25563_cov_118.074419_9_plen_154_part_00
MIRSIFLNHFAGESQKGTCCNKKAGSQSKRVGGWWSTDLAALRGQGGRSDPWASPGARRAPRSRPRKTTTSQSLEAIFPLVETIACAATPCTPERPQPTGYARARRLLYYTASPIEGSRGAPSLSSHDRRMRATFQGVDLNLHGFSGFCAHRK